jgi:general secretion pathway protein I
VTRPSDLAVRSAGRSRTGARRTRGFSLLEVLVAFVILALVATALFRLFSASLNNASAAEDWSRALLLAESRLDIAASTQPLREVTDRGIDDTGRIQWETRVAPFTPPDVSPELETASDALATRLFRVTADVTFPGVAGGERTLSLATVKIAQRNPP